MKASPHHLASLLHFGSHCVACWVRRDFLWSLHQRTRPLFRTINGAEDIRFHNYLITPGPEYASACQGLQSCLPRPSTTTSAIARSFEGLWHWAIAKHCKDGSDEPGTAACAGRPGADERLPIHLNLADPRRRATDRWFYCPNSAGTPRYVYSSRRLSGKALLQAP